jgi:undecaprenyl-diphosphatase
MSFIQILIIALVQGITEWLPISSSGHVLLAADAFALQGRDEVLVNAMAHLGTLFAVLVYFRRDVGRAIVGGVELLGQPFRGGPLSEAGRLAALILAATPIAVAVAGAYEIFKTEALEAQLRSVYVVAATSIVFGLLLWWADARGARHREVRAMGLRDAVLIGATQAIAALLPGTSRSGITMTAARALGFARTEAARFSMLIGAPLLAMVGGYALLELYTMDATEAATAQASMGDGLQIAFLSFVSGLASIWALMALLKRISFLPFVIYRLVLGVVLIAASPWGLGWIS